MSEKPKQPDPSEVVTKRPGETRRGGQEKAEEPIREQRTRLSDRILNDPRLKRISSWGYGLARRIADREDEETRIRRAERAAKRARGEAIEEERKSVEDATKPKSSWTSFLNGIRSSLPPVLRERLATTKPPKTELPSTKPPKRRKKAEPVEAESEHPEGNTKETRKIREGIQTLEDEAVTTEHEPVTDE